MSFSKQIICFYLFLIGFKLIETSDVSEDDMTTTKKLVKSKAGLDFNVDSEEDPDARRHRRTWGEGQWDRGPL